MLRADLRPIAPRQKLAVDPTLAAAGYDGRRQPNLAMGLGALRFAQMQIQE
jgi:hypothetical protein